MKEVDYYKCKGPEGEECMTTKTMDAMVTTTWMEGSHSRTVDCDAVLYIKGCVGALCKNVPGALQQCVFYRQPDREQAYKLADE